MNKPTPPTAFEPFSRPDPEPTPLDTVVSVDDLPRHRFTWDEVLAMVEAGVLREDDRVELIGGELVRMSPKGARHEAIKHHFNRVWCRQAPDVWWVAVDTPLRLATNYAPEPDVFLHRAETQLPAIALKDLAVVVEIADTSLRYDLQTKAPIYATYGIPEYWVIDARSGITHVHSSPTPSEGYSAVEEIAPTQVVTPKLVPELAIRLADAGLDFSDALA